MMTTLLIARHGNTFGPQDLIRRVGITDLPLVASGLIQGRQLGEYLLTHQLMPDVIFTSTLKRTIQTAEEAQHAMNISLPIQSLSMFNEIDYGPDENQTEEQVVARVGKEALQAWEEQAIVPQGWQVNPLEIIENWKKFAQRLRQEYAGKTCLTITSNGIARFSPHLTGEFAKFSIQHRIKISTGSFCIFTHQGSSDIWQCEGWDIKPRHILSDRPI
jgi:2,3-bisphosphoglycerate-dependent phosphoglycerate mutase